MAFFFEVETEGHDGGRDDEVDDEEGDGGPKVADVALANALAEEDAVMVISGDADLAVFTVLGVLVF
eukprot:CAMPEP_0168618404 /NCGR_PEP_ID=MMETSP0449_2-20121227/6056_1 /TAXON_ID=1082188 /ORGANISM="Strombidium rassoulzadegani, Strain ras09" /LENGTH=66 /DNA_ID=CAMNT_0008659281 /DNA_START=112 /DNA_END=312 /DNA_ORIENTATION=-